MPQNAKHIPVMLPEVIEALNIRNGGIYIDATFGFGGYTQGILEHADCHVIAIDRDPTVSSRADEFKHLYGDKFNFYNAPFSTMDTFITSKVDGIVFDIGVSSMQLDDASRGFSFSKPAFLDMRMSCEGLSAFDIVNTYGAKEIADILYLYGEERKSRQIAQKIIEQRSIQPINTTTELADIVHSVLGKKIGATDSATRTFQALRIAVNNELGELQTALHKASELLKPEGRLVVVDFHSLEDRIVKNFFKENADKKEHVSRYKTTASVSDKLFSYISKVFLPSASQIASNPRARSAKMRFAVKNKGVSND